MSVLATILTDYIAEHGFWPDDATLPMRPMLFVAILVVGLLLVRKLWIGSKRLRLRLEPLRRYRAIARQVGLESSDQWWLWRLARSQGLSSPLTLLICRSTLTHYAHKAAEHLSDSNRALYLARAEFVSRRLFPNKAQG